MRLFDLQSALGVALLQPDGLGALDSKDAWEAFCQKHDFLALQALPQERLHLYEELLFSGVESTLTSLFPFCRRFFSRQEWFSLVEKYRRDYPNTSYQLYRCAEGFPEFIANQGGVLRQYPFLAELAEYEWQEVVLLNAKNPELPEATRLAFPENSSDLQLFSPVWNPVSALLRFEYPIPAIISQIDTLEEIPVQVSSGVGPIDILLYREPDTFKIRFFQLNPLTAALLRYSKENASYRQVFETLHGEVPALAPVPWDTVISEGVKLFAHCFEEKLLLGSVPYGAPCETTT